MSTMLFAECEGCGRQIRSCVCPDEQVTVTEPTDDNDRWLAIQHAGALAAILPTIQNVPRNHVRIHKINRAIDRLIGAIDDPDWVAPWKEQQQ